MAAIPIALLTENVGAATEVDQPLQVCPEVLGAIYVAHYAHVLKVCQRFFQQREDAEDAASEVFLKLHKIVDKKDANVPFRPWVSRVAGRHCIDMLRHRKGEKRWCVAGVDVNGVPDRLSASPLRQAQRREERRRLREQVIHLPEHYMVPLVLHYYNEMSYTAIARRLDKGLPAVKTTMHRAKQLLRRNLENLDSAGSCAA
jgi:RNA polymerase sigma-70 factor, ECF subfamily